MSKKSRTGLGLMVMSAAMAVIGLAAAAPGAGCVPQPLVSVQPQESAPAGGVLTVEALAVSGPAEIRWNSPTGPKLADANGPSFSVPITVPDVPAGLYGLLVVERQVDGSLGSTGRAAVLVTAPPSGDGKTTTPAAPTTVAKGSSRNTDVSLATAVGGGFGMLVAGGLAGAALSSRPRRRRQPAA